MLVALLVCLIPTTIGALLSAIGIAGMDRLVQHNVLAMSGRAVEAAGDVNTLLLDKTGTITLGNRQAAELIPVAGVSPSSLADAAQLSSLADETPEGRSIVVLAKREHGLRERSPGELVRGRLRALHGPDPDVGRGPRGRRLIRKGAASAVMKWVRDNGGHPTGEVGELVDAIATSGGTPLVVAEKVGDQPATALGVVHLKDVIKDGIRERFDEMRRMGIRTVMITGDNPLTARAIAAEAGVDDFLAEATPEDKMALIKREQDGGRLVAMTGDGTNDAPALAQADVGVAMNTGTSSAKEAGNMVDLDSNPTKLIEIVEIGKQLLDHPRLAHDVLDRQRRGQVLRDHPGDVRRRLPGARPAQHHAPRQPAVRDPLGRRLQRPHHHRPDPARPARRSLHALRRQRDAPTQPGDLRPRRHHRPLRRDQAHRPRRLHIPRHRLKGTHPCPPRSSLRSPGSCGRRCGCCSSSPSSSASPTPWRSPASPRSAYPSGADGSLVRRDGQVVGSELIGQSFVDQPRVLPVPALGGR